MITKIEKFVIFFTLGVIEFLVAKSTDITQFTTSEKIILIIFHLISQCGCITLSFSNLLSFIEEKFKK